MLVDGVCVTCVVGGKIIKLSYHSAVDAGDRVYACCVGDDVVVASVVGIVVSIVRVL